MQEWLALSRWGLDGGAFPPERKTFTDPNGNPIVVLAGKSGAVTYTNLDTNESLTFPSRGTALRVTTQSDETQLLEFSGNVGILLFPLDVPAGPSTTQINGRLVLSVGSGDRFYGGARAGGEPDRRLCRTFLTTVGRRLVLSHLLPAPRPRASDTNPTRQCAERLRRAGSVVRILPGIYWRIC